MNLRHWKVKGIIQKGLSVIPGGLRVNDWLQLSVGGLKNFDANISVKVSCWEQILKYLTAIGHRIEGLEIVEVGSGWYPTLPMCHILGGARTVHTVDIVRHMKDDLTLRMFRTLAPSLERIALASGRPLSDVREHYAELSKTRTTYELLAAANIVYHAPEDASNLQLPAESIDLLYSNSVLEHVASRLIPPIMREARRVLKPDGLMLHTVACNDHYAHFDKAISFVNFVRFTEREWRFWNNPLNYQNRLRAIDYTRMAQEAGFRIAHEARDVRPGSREALNSIPVAPEFQHYEFDDLVATTVDFIAVKRMGEAGV